MERVLRTGAPLALQAIKQVAPAVFAQEPFAGTSPRYAYVPTIQPLQMLLDNGWGVYEARQQRSRSGERDPYTKHMLRIRKMDHFNVAVGDTVPEVVLINAHDGSASYRLSAGIFRLVCANGMMVGNKISSFVVRHTIGPATSEEVLAAGERTITEKFPAMMEAMEAMQRTKLERDAQEEFAKLAMRLRYGDTVPPFPATDLLSVRRPVDDKPDVWHVLNRIQENVMNGGWQTRSALFGRASTVRPVERVTAVAKINGGLWDHAMELAGV